MPEDKKKYEVDLTRMVPTYTPYRDDRTGQVVTSSLSKETLEQLLNTVLKKTNRGLW